MPIKTAPVVLPANSPLLPPPCTQELAWAVKSLASGEANKGEQTMILGWIIRDLCRTYDLPYRPGSQSDTDFALGMMHVGQELVKLVNMTPERITKLPRMSPSTDEDDGAMKDR